MWNFPQLPQPNEQRSIHATEDLTFDLPRLGVYRMAPSIPRRFQRFKKDGNPYTIIQEWRLRLRYADKEAKDNNGWTPLIWATETGYLDIASLLK